MGTGRSSFLKIRESPRRGRQTKSCNDQMEIVRVWTYGPRVTDLPVMVEDEIV